MLSLSTSGRYAVRILVHLARCEGGRAATKQEIARAENLSGDYIEQILLKLRNAGIVASRRGPGGGFVLARAPGTITVSQVLQATDGPIHLAPCAEKSCDRAVMCVTRRLWDRAAKALDDVFGATTIGGLADEARSMNRTSAYNI